MIFKYKKYIYKTIIIKASSSIILKGLYCQKIILKILIKNIYVINQIL